MQRGIRLFVLPPRSPKLHGAVERANGTHTEEFYEVTTAEPDLPSLQAKYLHHPAAMRDTCCMNCRFLSDESKKKLWRPCREARALER
jgi:hypothetical protein